MDDWRTRFIGYAFAALLVGSLLLVVYGFASAYKDCKDKGGEYVKKIGGGYTCVKENK